MPPTLPSKNVRCRYCQYILPGWLPLFNKPDEAMLLNHLSAMHPVELKPLLRRMETEDIGAVVMEAFDRVDLA